MNASLALESARNAVGGDPLASGFDCKRSEPCILNSVASRFGFAAELKPLRPPADEDLHDLIAERYETAATIVTSNLDFTEWDQAFPANRLLASATLDRLRHNAYCLVLDGQAYRAPKLPPTTLKSKVATTSKSTHS